MSEGATLATDRLLLREFQYALTLKSDGRLIGSGGVRVCDPESRQADNAASARVMEKVGMQREAHLREQAWFKDRWWDSLIYAVLEDEWRTARLDRAAPPGL